MRDAIDSPQRILNRTATVVLICGGVLSLFSILNWVQVGPRIVQRLVQSGELDPWALDFLITGCVPFSYLILSQFIRRRRYGSFIITGVLSFVALATMLCNIGTELLDQSLWSAIVTPRFVVLLSIYCLAYGAMIVFLILGRKAFVYFPDGHVVAVAKSRAVSSLRVLSVTVFGMAAVMIFSGFRWLVMDILFSMESYVSFWGQLSVVIVTLALGYALFFGASQLRKRDRPGKWLIGLICFLIVSKWICGNTIRLESHNGLLSWVLSGLLLWCLIELIHARRFCTESPPLGFEPIFATPVIPLGSNDAPSA